MDRLRSRKRLVLIICAIAVGICAFAAGCSKGSSDNSGAAGDESGKKMKIVATLFPQYDFARQIAGDDADVTLLLPPGMESHSYDLRPADMIEIRESDMFIYTGKYMEVWAQTIIDSLDDSVMVVDVSDGITLEKEEDYFVDEHSTHEHSAHEHSAHEDTDEDDEHGAHEDTDGDDEHGAHENTDEDDEHDSHAEHSHSGHTHEYDPHIWTSPVYAMQMVENIVDALMEKDPQHAEEYRQRADEYIDKLAEVDAAFRQVSEESARRTIFFGGRFAMTYFVREYDFDCVSAYHDCSAESEPSISSVMRMIDEIKESGAKAVYYEELADPKVARTIAEETGVKLLLLHSAHNVSRQEYENGVTYLDIMWNNVEKLKEGLN